MRAARSKRRPDAGGERGQTGPRAPRTYSRLAASLVCLGLVSVTLAVFANVRRFELVDFDDLTYVSDNARVQAGLSPDSVIWAFSGTHEGYWSPLTWLSYMADVEMAGLDPGQFHVTNLLLHVASVCLAFWVFLSLTRALWPSAIVAVVFAIHPLHVESVAWVAERKDVLSGMFFWLTLTAYVGYVRHATVARYLLVMAAFACGLMAKPMLVTLPVVLLCLDVWPLGRLRGGVTPADGGARPAQKDLVSLLVEKLPLATLSLAAGLVTIAVQQSAGAVASLDAIPLARRLANALVSLVWYPAKTVWPADLAVLYPYPAAVPVWQAAGSAALLAAVSWWVWRERQRRPYLIAGWLWYLVMLLPVLGLLQAGSQARADRYTYLAMTGLVGGVVWLAEERVRQDSRFRRLAGLSAGAIVTALAILSWYQVQHWRTTETLFRRALAVTERNHIAHAGLAMSLRSQGYLDEAIRHLEEAIRIQPAYAEAHGNLGDTLVAAGRPAAALPHLREAVRLKPDGFESQLNLASALNTVGDHEAAADAAERAVRLGPEAPSARSALGIARAGLGDVDGAVEAFQEAIRLNPDYVDARYNLGLFLARLGRTAEAAAEFREVVRIDPDSSSSWMTLGTLLATAGEYEEAIAALTRAVALSPSDGRARYNLGGALFARGRATDAVREFAEAVRLAPDVVAYRQALEIARKAPAR